MLAREGILETRILRSRMGDLRFSDNARIETFVTDLMPAFEFSGAVPRQVPCDDARTAVLERHACGPQQHRFHPRLRDLALSYGFQLRLCQPYRARAKRRGRTTHDGKPLP